MEEIRGPRGLVVFDQERGVYGQPSMRRGRGSQYDWGSDFTRSVGDRSVAVVEFKNGRRDYYLNGSMLRLRSGDMVCVGCTSGFDVGVVSLSGWLASRAYGRWRGDREHTLHRVLRYATRVDLDRWLASTSRERDAMLLARNLSPRFDASMKVVDVEFQGDGSRAAFYYSAEKRVDFRELVRALAAELHVRVEMRQIGARQESALLGGLGTCGQGLCCKHWLRNYPPVTTSVVKLQDMTPNPQKQAGQCGKLKCCLNFEVDHYAEAKRLFPRVKAPLQLEGKQLYHVKNDLFRHLMYFSTEPRGAGQHVVLTLGQVEEIMEQNAEGKLGASIENLVQTVQETGKPQVGYENVIEEESITRFDQQRRGKLRRDAKRGVSGKRVTGEGVGSASDGGNRGGASVASGSPRVARVQGNTGGSRGANGSSSSGSGARGGSVQPRTDQSQGNAGGARVVGGGSSSGSGARGGVVPPRTDRSQGNAGGSRSASGGSSGSGARGGVVPPRTDRSQGNAGGRRAMRDGVSISGTRRPVVGGGVSLPSPAKEAPRVDSHAQPRRGQRGGGQSGRMAGGAERGRDGGTNS